MPNAWELAHGLNPLLADPDDDLDGDGLLNLEEFQAGTDPSRADSVFRSSVTYRAGTVEAVLSWSSVPGKRYRVASATSLDGPFVTWGDYPAAEGDKTTLAVPAATLSRFFKVVVAPEPGRPD